MTQIIGVTVKDLIYKRGLPCLVVSTGKGESGKFNIYLNPSIKPELVKPEGKRILLIEGDFLPGADIFSPSLIVLWDENGLSDHKLIFD